MALRDLFGKAKSTAKKAGRDAKRAEEYAGKVYDREVSGAGRAHKRGSKAVGEFGDRAFGFDRDDDDDSRTPVGVALGVEAGEEMDFPDAMGGGGMDTPEMPNVMGDRNADDDEWYW